MKAVLQRVSSAKVETGGRIAGEIGQGLLILLGVTGKDGVDEADFLAEKSANLRIFEDENGKLNRSLLDVGGGMLVVSNFTLCADARHGRRPIHSMNGLSQRRRTPESRQFRPVFFGRICRFRWSTTVRSPSCWIRMRS